MTPRHWLNNRRLAIAIAVSAAIILGFELRFLGDCGDTINGWTCDAAGTVAICGFLTVALVLALLLLVAAWRLGRVLVRRLHRA